MFERQLAVCVGVGGLSTGRERGTADADLLETLGLILVNPARRRE